jgi:hypothetical protein
MPKNAVPAAGPVQLPSLPFCISGGEGGGDGGPFAATLISGCDAGGGDGGLFAATLSYGGWESVGGICSSAQSPESGSGGDGS